MYLGTHDVDGWIDGSRMMDVDGWVPRKDGSPAEGSGGAGILTVPILGALDGMDDTGHTGAGPSHADWRVRTSACQSGRSIRPPVGTSHYVFRTLRRWMQIQANPLRIITISTHLALGDGNGSHLDSPPA